MLNRPRYGRGGQGWARPRSGNFGTVSPGPGGGWSPTAAAPATGASARVSAPLPQAAASYFTASGAPTAYAGGGVSGAPGGPNDRPDATSMGYGYYTTPDGWSDSRALNQQLYGGGFNPTMFTGWDQKTTSFPTGQLGDWIKPA